MISLRSIWKRYPGASDDTVKNVSLELAEGQMLVLLGQSGCGKTTTMEMINGLSSPTKGEVWVNGQNVNKVNQAALRRTIGYVMQGSALFPHMTVYENIAVVPRLLGWKEEQIKARIDVLLKMIELTEKPDKLPSELSGGQQQRVGFARALAAEPKVMLLDEPFGALDPEIREKLRKKFLDERQRQGVTAVMVTHDMYEAMTSADVIAVMEKGIIVQLGTPRELLENPVNDFVRTLIHGPEYQYKNLVTHIYGGQPS